MSSDITETATVTPDQCIPLSFLLQAFLRVTVGPPLNLLQSVCVCVWGGGGGGGGVKVLPAQ